MKTKVVEIYEEGTKRVFRSVKVRVPAHWEDANINQELETRGTEVDRWIDEGADPEVDITQIKVLPTNAEPHEDWTDGD